MKGHALPDWPGLISHAEFEFVNTARSVERLHSVKDSAKVRSPNQGLSHHEAERVIDMLRQVVAMALLIEHVGPAIHLEGYEGGRQLAMDFGCPHFETVEIGSGSVAAAPVRFRLLHLAPLPSQGVDP